MTVTMVEVEFDVPTSVQFTSVPFRLSLTGLISNCDVSGKLLPAEIIKKVNVIEFTSKADVGELELRARAYLLDVVSPSGIRKKLHSRNRPLVVHVNSNWSPLHTGAIPGGDITTPVITAIQ